jgi:flagellar protein FliS
MAPAQAKEYLTNHYQGMDPEQLILLLYKGALSRIELTRQGIQEKNIQKRGENLSKVIAIVSELNASLKPEANDEGTQFLKGLYTAILTELPKVSLTNDTLILDRAEKYIARLKEIWETHVMGKTGSNNQPVLRTVKPEAAHRYGSAENRRFSTISV